jgi:hypothetical protein
MHYTKGGVNFCILVKDKSVLPNCVGYAWGRWTELLGDIPKLSRSNAENWWGKADGYSRGQTPKLGAVACWRKGLAGVASDGAGHVAIVEDILQDGSIVTSNSAWNGTMFYKREIKPPYNIGSSYTFQGFIYLPIEFAPNTPDTITAVAREVIQGKLGNGNARKQRLIKAGYDYNVVQARVNQLITTSKIKKSVDELAKEVIQGKWGNGNARKEALLKAGYNYSAVQARVEQLLK